MDKYAPYRNNGELNILGIKDLAFHGTVLEYCNHPEDLKNTRRRQYDNKRGYLGLHTPGYLTLDLHADHPIEQVSLFLWDIDDPCNSTPAQFRGEHENQNYSFRLLASVDRHRWLQVFDSSDLFDRDRDVSPEKHFNGWVTIKMKTAVQARYIRIHAMHNRNNDGFHVVRFHAFSRKNDLFDNHLVFPAIGYYQTEYGDAYPLANKLLDFAHRMQHLEVGQDDVARSKHREIVDYAIYRYSDLESTEGRVDPLRKLLSLPVSSVLEKEFTKNSWMGWLAFGLSIISLLLLLYNIFFS